MSCIAVDDLVRDPLTDASAAEVLGGWAGFLSGLFAGRPGSALVPSITQNYLIDYDQTIIQQNPVNLNIIAGDQGVNAIGDISIMNVNTGNAAVAQMPLG